VSVVQAPNGLDGLRPYGVGNGKGGECALVLDEIDDTLAATSGFFGKGAQFRRRRDAEALQ
jgi:hypothetical protein